MTTYHRAPAVSAALLGDEITLMEPSSGVYFGLEGPGARIWELLATPRTLDTLVGLLVVEFDVDAETCTAHVVELLTALQSKGLVRGVPAGPA